MNILRYQEGLNASGKLFKLSRKSADFECDCPDLEAFVTFRYFFKKYFILLAL